MSFSAKLYIMNIPVAVFNESSYRVFLFCICYSVRNNPLRRPAKQVLCTCAVSPSFLFELNLFSDIVALFFPL